MKEQINIVVQPDETKQLAQEGPEKESGEVLYGKLIEMVGDIYADRLSQKTDLAGAKLLLQDNLNHVRQVKDNVDFIVEEIKSGRMTDELVPRDAEGQIIFDERLLKTMAVLHDVAKISEAGELDTFGHHERAKVEQLLAAENSPISKFLKNNGFTPEEVNLMIDGIERHSRRTDFIFRKYAKDEKGLAELPAPEGVLEFVILSDADILTQSKLNQGVKKIICSRLMFDFFRQEDSVGGRHSFLRTLDSVLDSAQKVSGAMHFDLTKQKAASQLEETLAFENWLKEGGQIEIIDKIEDFGLKKKKIDELIGEFLSLNKQEERA